MLFEKARILSEVLHYIISISILAFICLYKNRDLLKGIIRFYIAAAAWAILCYIINGCPLSHLENVISLHYYNKLFYENYGFERTDIKYLLGWKQFYIPLALALIIYTIKFINGSSSINVSD